MIKHWLVDARKTKSPVSISLLRALDSLPVGLEQIKSTGIGKVVKGFTKTEFSPDVQSLSAKLIESWTKLVVSHADPPVPAPAAPLQQGVDVNDDRPAKRVKIDQGIPAASSLSMVNLNAIAEGTAEVKSYKRLDDTTAKKKRKRVTFATGSQLCQVRLFHSEVQMVGKIVLIF